MGLKGILKSANPRSDLSGRKSKAVKIAKRDGISVELADARVWKKRLEA